MKTLTQEEKIRNILDFMYQEVAGRETIARLLANFLLQCNDGLFPATYSIELDNLNNLDELTKISNGEVKIEGFIDSISRQII